MRRWLYIRYVQPPALLDHCGFMENWFYISHWVATGRCQHNDIWHDTYCAHSEVDIKKIPWIHIGTNATSNLIFDMLNLLTETCIYIYLFEFPIITRHWYGTGTLNPSAWTTGTVYGCSWYGDARSQVISLHDTDLVLPEYSGFHTRRVGQ